MTQDIAYSRQLAARHPEWYETLLEFETRPGTRDALLAAGGRSRGRLLDSAGLEHLPPIQKAHPDVVHIKAERGFITFGLRPGSAHIFNDRIVGIEVVE